MAKSVKKLSAQNDILKLPYLVLIVTLLLTIGATYIFYQSARSKDVSRFQSEATGVKNRIEILTSTNIALLKSGRGFVESTGALNREKFADFVNSLELEKNYSSIRGIGFSKRLSADEKDEFIKKMQLQGKPDFKIFPEMNRPEYHAIIYLEPLDERSSRAIGFDMSTESNRREAMEKARDTGEATATGKIFLGEETNKEPGFLIYVPVYKSGKMPETVLERRNLLDGYVYSPFRANNFLRDVQKSTALSDIAVTIYEGEQGPEQILAQTNPGFSSKEESYVSSSELNVAGRKWIIGYETLPSFSQQSSTGWTPIIFVSGFLSSLILFGMTYLESYARAKAEKITRELQESEREKGFLLEREQIERKRAEEANKAKDEFISIVSHELRTPLNSIAGWTKILHAENLSPATKKQALQKIDKSLRMQTKLVEDLLDFSQIMSGNSLNKQEIDFSKMFEASFDEAGELAAKKGVVMIKENSLNGQKISGDKERLQGVVKNLLSNAIKFTPAGGKVVTNLKKDDSNIEIIIKDTGEGIRPDFLPHIFEHFKQADSSTTREHGGLGLGLAISNQIIKLHGGSIEAESEGEGKGATFIVKIPLDGK